jgi:hypothetical protein
MKLIASLGGSLSIVFLVKFGGSYLYGKFSKFAFLGIANTEIPAILDYRL